MSAMLAHGDYPYLTALFSAYTSGAAAPLDNHAAFAAGPDAVLFGVARPASPEAGPARK
ncbi:hypothetical protein ACWDTG_03265 [Rhodococcus zopfii]|uniref:hypothetical protein n=1 Tax=Rhodococcus zopfii TaxID=43772 RepID=UPI001486C148|nr:hypothetical protein [Rhodococcus zopfii]